MIEEQKNVRNTEEGKDMHRKWRRMENKIGFRRGRKYGRSKRGRNGEREAGEWEAGRKRGWKNGW